MPQFKAAVKKSVTPIIPEMIEITDRYVIHKKRKRYFPGYETITIPFSKIFSIEINANVTSTVLIIQSVEEDIIKAHRFALEDTIKIKQLIESQL